jgi:hypothetical protein
MLDPSRFEEECNGCEHLSTLMVGSDTPDEACESCVYFSGGTVQTKTNRWRMSLRVTDHIGVVLGRLLRKWP